MTIISRINRTQLTATAAVCVVGLLIAPAAANARPPMPLAPFCGNWAMEPGPFVINQDNNIVVEMDGWDGQTPSGQHVQYKLSFSLFGQSPEVTPGAVVDGAIEGNTIHFKADWDPRPGSSDWNEYTGTIDADGYAHGTTHNDGQLGIFGDKNDWGSVQPLTCIGSPGLPWMPKVKTSS